LNSTATDNDRSAPSTAALGDEAGDAGDPPNGGLVGRLWTTLRAGAGRKAQSEAPHRLRDLDRRGKLWAGGFAFVLLLAPVLAFVDVVSDWAPFNDPALIGIQSLEVGTRDTPLTGQPSTSAHYVEADRHVNHLGPLHAYMMAGPIRLFGPAVGMLSISVVIIGAAALLMAWAFFRRLGPTGGIVGATLVGLVMFTTGAATLMTPVSSNMAGYPLLCSAVLLWCVMRGDLRLLPLATGVTAFAAQQHLSVVPAVAVLAPAAVVGMLWHWQRTGGRDDMAHLWLYLRRKGEAAGEAGLRERFPALARLTGWTGAALVVGVLLWSPMLTQEVTDDHGNLSALVELSRDSDRPTLGMSSAVNQVTHVLSVPPLLGRTDIESNSAVQLLLENPPWTATASALAVLALVALLGVLWAGQPDKRSLTVWVGVLIVAGLVNGSSVLDSIEQWRMVLYHWIWPLTLFTALVLALGVIDGVRALLARLNLDRVKTAARSARPAFASLALVAIALPALVNPNLDRPSNELNQFRAGFERRYVEELVSQILDEREAIDEPVVMLSTGAEGFMDAREPVTLYLLDEGVDAQLTSFARDFVADRRVARDDHDTSGLLIVHDYTPEWREVEAGTLIADVTTVDSFDSEAFDTARAKVEAVDTFTFGPEIEQVVEAAHDEWVRAAEEGRLAEISPDSAGEITMEEFVAFGILHKLDMLHTNPAEALSDPDLLDLLLEHPMADPVLEPELLERLSASDDDTSRPTTSPLRLRVYLLAPHELEAAGF
jgi:hypothetical protein